MRKMMVLLVMAFLLAGCSDETADKNEPEEVVTYESTTIESEQETVEEEPETEEVEEEKAPEEPQQVEVEWGQEEVGPMTFDAPISWKSSEDSNFYAPHGPNGEFLGYYFSVGFNDYPSGNIENFVSRDVGQYDDVEVEELEIAGYPAGRLQYNRIDEDETTSNITYYIQIYPEAGLGIISYVAPESDPELYMEDFERLFNSLSIEGSSAQDSNNEKTYILNRSTGTFHTQDCYKVKQIENAESVSGTVQELINQGYKGCEICNPR